MGILYEIPSNKAKLYIDSITNYELITINKDQTAPHWGAFQFSLINVAAVRNNNIQK